MSKRPKHLRRLWKRTSTFTKVLTAFVTLAMVLEMFPAQSVAYARQVVFEAVGVDPAVLVQPVEPEEEAPAAAETPAATEEVVVEETEPAEAVEAEDEVVVPEDQTEPAAETEDQGEAVVEETEVAPAPEEETKADEAEAETQPEAEVKPEEPKAEEPKAEEPKAEDKKDEAAKPEYPAQTLQTRLGNTIITVTADPGSLPAGSKVVASWYDTGAVQEAVEAAAAAEGKTVDDMVAIDVTILDANGNEVQPNSPVQVKFLNAGVQGDDISVYHIEHESGEATPVATDVANSVTQRFVADGFSVYVVVDKGEQADDARLTVNFVLADGSTKSMMITKNQLAHIAEYVYDPGVGTLGANEMFKGWTDNKDYTTETSSLTIADVRTAVTNLLNAGVEEGDSVTYYAMIFKAYNINYLDEKSVTVKTDQIVYRKDDASSTHSYTVNQSYTPYAQTEEEQQTKGIAEFLGWEQINPTPSKIYQNNDTIENVTSDIYLKAYVRNGFWITFNENISGASFTQPQFVVKDEHPAKPSDPTRPGYTFGGWYTEDASDARDGAVAGDEFNFASATLSKNTTVHAKWTVNNSADYTVIIWKQRVDGQGYDFAESVKLSGTVGATINTVTQNGSNVNTGTTPAQTRNVRVNGTEKAYTGFHCARFDQNVTIAAEGTSVLNVYYDRNTITINFDADDYYIYNANTGGYSHEVTYTGLYEAPLTFDWPTTKYNRSGGTGSSSTLWYDGETILTLLGAFKLPTNSDTSIDLTRSNAGNYPIYFYQMDGSGNYSNTPKDTIYAGNGTFTLTNKYTGFELDTYRRNGSGDWSAAADGNKVTQGYSQLQIRYKRVQKTIAYLDGVYVDPKGSLKDVTNRGKLDETEAMYYGADVSSYGKGGSNYYEPTYAGYVFLGWFADKECTQEYKFTTMPADGITVYAKWMAREYTVVLHPNADGDSSFHYTSETQPDTFHADYADKVGNVGGERDAYDLIGWFSDEACTHPYAFDAYVLDDNVIAQYGDAKYREADRPSVVGKLDLYAKWRSKLDGADGIQVIYDAGAGDNAPTDSNKYVDLAEAIAGAASKPTDTNKVFSHWVVQKWNGTAFEDTNVKVFPGDTFVVKVADAHVEEITPTATDPSTKSYTVQLKAQYIEKDKEVKTHIDFYSNYGSANEGKGELYKSYTDLKINEAVDIYAAPTRAGYEFKGWTKTKGGTTADFLVWDGSKYTNAAGKAATQVAADERQPYDDIFAVWEAIDVNYTVEFYYQNDNGEGYTIDSALTATRQAKTDSTASATDADKGQTKNDKYILVSGDPSVLSATVAGDGSTVLKLYFNLNKVGVTVEHYLLGQTTAFKTDTVKDQVVGSTYTATPETTYQEKNLTVNSYDPSASITVKTSGNVIKIYYTLPLTITAKTDKKTYDGKPLAGEYTIDGALTADEAGIKTALGTAPSITNVSESPKQYQAATDGIPEYYVIANTPGTLTIEPLAVTITAEDAEKVYDAKALTQPGFKNTDLAEGDTHVFTVVMTDGSTITDKGEKANVIATVDGVAVTTGTPAQVGNYTVTTVDGKLTVNPKAVTITTGSDSKAYDGTPLTKDEATIEGLVTGESVTLKATGTITEVGSTDNTYSITWDKAKKDNYTVTENLGKLTITQSDAQVVLTAASGSKTYDGKALTDATVTATGLPEGFTYEATASGSQTDAGESANVVNDGYKFFDKDGNDKTANFTKVQKVDGKLTVNPKAVTITTGSDSKAYDGTPLTKDEATIEGLVTGESVTLKATGTITEVGSTDNTYSITWDKAKKDNYTVTENLGTLTITQNSSEVTLTAASGEKTYDGKALTDATVTADGLPEGFTYEATATGSQTDAGSSKNVVNDGYKFFDKDGNDKTANFTNVKKVDGTLTVNPKDVTLTSADGEKVYDGKALTNDKVTAEGFVEGEGATYDVTGSQTEVGESENEFTYTLNNNTKADNYTIKTVFGTLKVTQLTDKVTVTITEHSDTVTYDGKSHEVTGYDVDIDNELYTEDDFTFSGTASVKGTDVAIYPMELKASDFTNTNKNFANVEFKTVDGTLTINPRKVVLTSENGEKAYDGTPLTKPEVKVEGDGFVEGEATVKAIGTITEVGTTPNTIEITKGAAFKDDNYSITQNEGALEITASTEKVTVTIAENSGTEKYDGTEKTVTGYGVTSISNPLYKVTDFTFTGNDTVKGTDAGKYAMELKSDDFTNTNKNFANVEFVIIDGELTIEPRKVTLTSATDEKQYDGNPLTNDEVTVSEDGFVKGEGATYDVTGTQTLVGSSENTFTYTLDEGTNAKNYTITTVNGTLTVINRDAKFEVTVKANSETATYDGKDHSAKGFETLTFDVEGNTYTVSGLTTEDPSKVDAGEYTNNITGTAVVKDAKGNDVTEQFAVHTENGKLVINKLEVVIKSGTAEKQYDGKALTNDEITYPKPFVEGEGAIITMTGTQTLVGTSDNSFEYKLRDNTKADNYTISTEFGTLTVTDREKPLEITVVSKSDEVTYDGAEHTVSGFETLEFTIDGVKFTVDGLSAKGEGTDAGEYPNTITGTAVVKDADGNDVTAQFEVKQTEGKLVIKPVSTEVVVTITEHSGEFEFDNTEKTVEGYDVTKISNNLYTDKDFSFSGDATVKGTEAGTYDMELKPADFANISKNFTNVKFEIVDGQLVITPKSIDDPDDPGKPNPDLTVEGPEDTVYNGLEQKQPVKVTDSKTGETLVEGEDFTLTYGDDMTNVGEVPVKVTGINNYKGEFDLSYKITPAPLKVTTSSAQKVYDATPLTSAEYEIEGLVNGETLDVKTTGSQTLVGESLNTAEITWADKNQVVTESINANLINLFAAANPTAKSTNYTLSVELGTLTVTDDGVPTDLVVKKTHEGTEFGLGETVTFTLTATNIYDEARDITFVEIEGVEVEQATFQKVPAGETVTTKATYVVTEADILAGEFKNEVTVKIGDAEHGPADDTVVIEKKNPHMTVTKTVVTAEPAAGFKKGDKIEYKIVVLNDGNVTISDIKVTDELTGDEWAVESLEPGKSAEFSASYTVTDADVTAGSVTNTATATGKDPDGDEPTVTPGTAKSNIAKPVKVKKRLPQTSDPTSIMAIEALATAGLASIASGLALLRRKQKHDDEE